MAAQPVHFKRISRAVLALLVWRVCKRVRGARRHA